MREWRGIVPPIPLGKRPTLVQGELSWWRSCDRSPGSCPGARLDPRPPLRRRREEALRSSRHSTYPEEGAEGRGVEGAACSPLRPPCRGRTLFPWSAFSSLQGEGEAACWKALHAPGSASLSTSRKDSWPCCLGSLAHARSPLSWQRGTSCCRGAWHSRPRASRAPGWLLECRTACPEAGKQLSRQREDSSPASTAARASCNLSRAKPSREVPLLEKGL